MQFVVPQSWVEPPFAFEFTCAKHLSVPLFAAAWLEGVPCLSVAIISTQRSALSQRLNLWQPGVQAEQHCIWTAPLPPGQGSLCGVPRNFREALNGNRRKQTETSGNRRKHTESHLALHL